jgi:hypothetical protein
MGLDSDWMLTKEGSGKWLLATAGAHGGEGIEQLGIAGEDGVRNSDKMPHLPSGNK